MLLPRSLRLAPIDSDDDRSADDNDDDRDGDATDAVKDNEGGDDAWMGKDDIRVVFLFAVRILLYWRVNVCLLGQGGHLVEGDGWCRVDAYYYLLLLMVMRTTTRRRAMMVVMMGRRRMLVSP